MMRLAATLVAAVFVLGFATIPAIAYPLGLVLFGVYLILSAPDRRTARKNHH